MFFNDISYEQCIHHFLQEKLKFNKICIYSNSIIQKRIPIIYINIENNGQMSGIPIFLDEKEEINNIIFNPKNNEIEITVLPNSTSIVYLYSE
jgi:hypothetical protein